MNWQAVIKGLRDDAKQMQAAQLSVPASHIAANAALATGAIILSKLADALQMGLNHANSA